MPAEPKRQLWYLRKFPGFGALPPGDLAALTAAAELRECPRRTTFYLPGDVAEHVYLLHGGRVAAYHVSAAGRTITLGLHGAGDLFGESCLWTAAPRDDMAVAATAVIVSGVPRAPLRRMLDEHPELERRLFERAVTRRDAAARRLCAALSLSVRARLAAQLLDLGEHGQDIPGGRELALELCHHEFAALLGTTRETVSLELRRFEDEGLIARHRRRIVLLDLPRLRALVHDIRVSPPRSGCLPSEPTEDP